MPEGNPPEVPPFEPDDVEPPVEPLSLPEPLGPLEPPLSPLEPPLLPPPPVLPPPLCVAQPVASNAASRSANTAFSFILYPSPSLCGGGEIIAPQERTQLGSHAVAGGSLHTRNERQRHHRAHQG